MNKKTLIIILISLALIIGFYFFNASDNGLNTNSFETNLSGGQVEPPSLSGGQVEPPSLSGGQVEPPSLSGGQVEPPSLSGGQVEPPE